MIRKATISRIMTAVGLLIRFSSTLFESLLEDSQESSQEQASEKKKTKRDLP